MMTICMNVEPYLAHYMYARYANCIREGAIKLSYRTNLYHTLLELTAPRPQGISWRDTGNLTLALPVPDIGKDPRTYNYLSGESVHLLAKKINRQMRREMIEYMLDGNSNTASCTSAPSSASSPTTTWKNSSTKIP